MQSVLTTDKRPNCLVIDEIDGAPTVSVCVCVGGGGGPTVGAQCVRVWGLVVSWASPQVQGTPLIDEYCPIFFSLPLATPTSSPCWCIHTLENA